MNPSRISALFAFIPLFLVATSISAQSSLPKELQSTGGTFQDKAGILSHKVLQRLKNVVPKGSIKRILKNDAGKMVKFEKEQLDNILGLFDHKHHDNRVRKSIRRNHRAMDDFPDVPMIEPPIIVHKNYTTFCDETTGPCIPGVNSTEEEEQDFLESVSQSRNDSQQLKFDEAAILELLGNLEYYLNKTKYEKLTTEEETDAELDLRKIAYLIKDLANVVEKRITNGEEETSKISSLSSSLSSSSSSSSDANQGISMLSTITTLSSELSEQQIADKMVESQNLDVSIMGNSAKELGTQMGKMPSNVAQSHDLLEGTTSTTVASTSSATSLLEDNNSSSESITTPEEQLSQENSSSESSIIETMDKHSEIQISTTSLNKSSSSSGSSAVNPLDIAVEKIDLSSLLYSDETNDMARVNEEHEKHKNKMLDLIRTLKITGKTAEDAKRVEQMIAQVEAIEREHHNLMRLKTEYRDNFPHGGRDHGWRRHHQYDQRRHHYQNNQHFQQQPPRPGQPMMAPYPNNNNDLNNAFNNAPVKQKQQYTSTNVENDWKVQIKTGQPVPPLVVRNQNNGQAENMDKNDIKPEINFNGGFEESVDKLKKEYPQGHWPKQVDSAISSNIAQKVQKLVEQNPELKPKPLPINIILKNNNEYEYEDDLNEGEEANNRVDITKRDLMENSVIYDDPLSPEKLETIIKEERKGHAAVKYNGPKRGHHIQEHDAKERKLQRSIKFNHNLAKRSRQRK